MNVRWIALGCVMQGSALSDAMQAIGWRTEPMSLFAAAVVMLLGLAVEYGLGRRHLGQ
jgi:hypothetical protein